MWYCDGSDRIIQMTQVHLKEGEKDLADAKTASAYLF